MMIETSFEAGIGTLKLNRPPLNILTREMLAELRDALRQMAEKQDLRVLVLAAAGRHFSAGADVAEHLPPQFRALIPQFIDTVKHLAEFPAPVVAAVRGKCLGGGFEVVQAADIVVAGEGAWFGQPEILLGVTAPVACALLPELCAPGLAAEIVFTGEAIGARQALEAGLVRHVVPDEAVEVEALELARRMARHSAAALRLTKQALRTGLAARRTAALAAAASVYVDELMQTADAVEGLQAFLEKREPTWKHR